MCNTYHTFNGNKSVTIILLTNFTRMVTGYYYHYHNCYYYHYYYYYYYHYYECDYDYDYDL